MEGRAIIQWNAENWITVVLMVAIMYALVGTIVAVLKGHFGGSAATASTSDAG